MANILLEKARQIAMTAAHQNGSVTADDVAAKMDEPLGPIAGSIFKTVDFVFTGSRIKSRRGNNHGRELKVWKLTMTGQKKAQAQAELVQRHFQPTIKDTQQAEGRSHRKPPTQLPSWLK